MSRLNIEFPASPVFSTEIKIHSVYINRGGHVGNSNYVELCNEVSLQFFASRNVAEYTVGKQILLNNEFSVQLTSEAKFSDILIADLGVDNFHRYGCDFVFRFTHKDGGAQVALAKLSFLTFDYQQGKIMTAADEFQSFFLERL